MQKHIQGTLRDPTGSILPNHEIRITSRSGITELHSVELTGSNGEYSFILTEGWKYLEVLFRNTYLLVGDILINEAAPAECTIEEILRYSTPVVVSSIYDLPTDINSLQETLEDGTYTFKREDRDQLIDTLVYKINLTNSWVSDDMLERGIRDISEISTCDSSIKDIKQVYSDDKGNSFSHATGSIKTKDGEVKNEVLVSDTIRVNEDITLGNYSYTLSKDINATTVTNSITKTKGSVVIQDSDTFTDTSLTKVKYATTEAGTFTDTTNLNSSNYTRNTSFNNIHQTTITINDTLVQDSSTVSINGVVSTDVFTNDGVSTQRNINIDKYVVGREGNDLFEVDSTTDTVTVRGNLRIEDIQDPDGNSLIPDDGDTIFQVFRYGETASGPWEDVLQSYHYWKQENVSVNGFIDPNGWSLAYKFRGEDGVGSPGDTIFFEYQYSPDGATDWSTELKAGDAFRRERRVVNGNPEAWSDPVRIKGENGDEVEIRSQYSVDGINNWHNVYTSGDMYERRARFINGVQDSAWSDPIKVVGKDGTPGLNGSGWYSIVNGTGVWPGDTQATADFLNTFGRVPQLDDHLFYVDKDPEPTKTDGRRCITLIGDTPVQWNNPRAYFDGDVIVKGSLSADRLVAQSVTGNEVDSQTTILAGSGSSTAGMNGYDLSTLPDWMGGGSNPYAGYRFWAGSSTPEFAPWKVSDDGTMSVINANIQLIGTTGLKVESANAFGPDNLLEWRGDVRGKLLPNGEVDLSRLTKANAVTYYSDDNIAYFGGTFIAGTLENSGSTSIHSSTASREISFTSNGGLMEVAVSFSYTRTKYGPTSGGPPTVVCPTTHDDVPIGTVYLEKYEEGQWVILRQDNIQGNYWCTDGEYNPEGGGTANQSYTQTYIGTATSSSTITEDAGNVKYRVRLLGGNLVYNTQVIQYLSIVVTE